MAIYKPIKKTKKVSITGIKTDDKDFIQQIRDMKAEYPDEVDILIDDDSLLTAFIPTDWIIIGPEVKE